MTPLSQPDYPLGLLYSLFYLHRGTAKAAVGILKAGEARFFRPAGSTTQVLNTTIDTQHEQSGYNTGAERGSVA